MSRAKIISDQVRADARELKMPGVARNFEALARQAGTEGWSPIEYLHEVLLDRSHLARRVGGEVAASQRALPGAEEDAAGDRPRCRGGSPAPTRRLLSCRRPGERPARSALHRRTRRVELLILDEVGFVPFDRTGGELLFNLLADRYQSRRSVIVTTNLSFAEWPKVFGGDEKLTTALLDRLAENATVIATKGKSYRMRRRQAVAESAPSATSSAKATRAKKTERRQKG